jgi:hypothetical protein
LEHFGLPGLGQPGSLDSPLNKFEITAFQLHELDKRPVPIGTLPEKFCDQAQFQRHRWHCVMAARQ